MNGHQAPAPAVADHGHRRGSVSGQGRIQPRTNEKLPGCVASPSQLNSSRKGSKVSEQGRIHYSEYTDRDGHKKYATEIIADEVYFLDTKARAERRQQQKMLHLTEFHRSAGASGPFRLAVDRKIAAAINRSFGEFVSPVQHPRPD